MSRRAARPLVALALAAGMTCATAPAGVAAVPVTPAQSEAYPGVDELWEEYPLDEERATDPPRAQDPPDDVPAPAPEGAGESPADAPPPADDGSTSRAAPPAAGRSPSPASAAPDRQTGSPGAEAPGGDDPGAALPPAVIAGGAAALLAALAFAFSARRRARARRARLDAYPVAARQVGNVYAEGFTERGGIGSFGGFVHAIVPGPDPSGDEMLCLGDPEAEDSLWVRRSEVTALRTVHAAEAATRARTQPDDAGAAGTAAGAQAGSSQTGEPAPRGSRFIPTGRSSRNRGPAVPSGGGSGRRRR